jgi:hypothetical protein
MLSVILYGCNDAHGYNYHKRLALCLNCLAELLSDPTDEIIFVDYNSPNELPTIVEAIQDTLTEKAKKTIKVFRMRPYQHARFKSKMLLLEPVARNVAIRRSNSKNKWILSTNADMVFVPTEKETNLTQIVANLDEGYYSLPRFELPENLWELSLKRLDPTWNISFLREQGEKLHLNTIVKKEGFVQYDNPGDFQLILRNDLVEMRGFDEKMLKRWHVDSNLSKRLSLFRKTGTSLEKVLKGYHCNHTQKASVHHDKNNWNHFVMNDAIIPAANSPDWGLLDEEIEEVALSSDRHLKCLSESLASFPPCEYEILRNVALYNKLTYSTTRIFTYLVDHLCNEPKMTNIAYIGYNPELVKMIDSYLKNNQFTGKIFYANELADIQASLVIFDFGFEENTPLGQKIQASREEHVKGRDQLKKIMKKFFRLTAQKNGIDSTTKVIGININYSDFYVIFLKHLSMRLSCYITGNSYGYLQRSEASKMKFPTLSALKKKSILNLRYFLIRFFFKYSDRIHAYVLRSKLSKIL